MIPGIPGITRLKSSLPVAFSNSRSLPVKRECDFQFPFPFPGAQKPFPLTPDQDPQLYIMGHNTDTHKSFAS